MTLTVILYTIFVYLIASIPFSLVVGRLVANVDIRDYGDGNPGATNVKRATGSTLWYIVSMLLDGFKALFPVGIPYWFFGWQGPEIIPVAIAALLGHAFSLYLRFRGGKAIASTGGVWIGLIVFEAVLVLPLTLVFWYRVFEGDEWATVLMMLSLLLYLLYTRSENGVLFAVWTANFLIILYKHRSGLGRPPILKLPKRE